MILLTILFPIITGIILFFINNNKIKKILLLVTSFFHLILSFSSFYYASGSYLDGMIMLDKIGRIFLCVMSVLFFFSVLYAVSYMRSEEKERKHQSDEEGFIFADSPKKLFISSLLFFCGTMSLVCVSRHLGLLWIAVEATTFASAPLVYYYHTRNSLHATWKYVMICSLGIGLSLIGNLLIMLAYKTHSANISLMIETLRNYAPAANKSVLLAAFVFFLVGYGTKTGLAPMHGWLPSAHAESPAFISSLLSGALLNCALLGILRVHSICVHAGVSDVSGKFMIVIGVFSVLIAAFSVVLQNDYKKILAYSSVEHMGMAVLAFGLGKTAILPAVLHIINHSFTKASLFLCSGNIFSAFETKKIDEIKGMFKYIPFSAFLWFAGILAICGLPPFGLFITEFMIFKEIFYAKNYIIAFLLSLSLLILFSSIAFKTIEMLYSDNEPVKAKNNYREGFLRTFTPLILLILTFALGLYLPDSFIKYITDIGKEFYP